ncbi:MAG TPA: hypothetical protein VK171_09920, partial [Fimbriimonas sp.]|nr:hypothetical protein [Fimbriimonas sp.]
KHNTNVDLRLIGTFLIAFVATTSMANVNITIAKDHIVLKNSFVKRVIQTRGFVGTTSFLRFDSNEEFLRTVAPEAKVTVDGVEYWLGGVESLPNQAFLDPKWLESTASSSKSLPLVQIQPEKLHSFVPHEKDWAPKGSAVTLKFDHSNFTATVWLEMYETVPGVAKRVVIQPKPGKTITVNQIVTERLGLVEGESEVEFNPNWRTPNVSAFSDLSFGGNRNSSTFWEADPSYTTQVNYLLKTPCVLEVRAPHGIHRTTSAEPVRSVTSYVLLHGGTDREQNSLEQRGLFRAVAPWVLDNPLMLHVVSNDDKEIRTAIDQAAECGFEMVIMSFGSGLNMEDVSPQNIKRWREHREYATKKGVRFGGYSLLASRRISDEHDVINPETGKTGGAIFGNSPCLGSMWGLEYFNKLRKFIEETGFQLLEHDGNYPGDRCASKSHPGHRGLEDSQWSQYQQITEFYRWCRARNVYLNVPDYYHLNGSNKTGMGYRETNWSLPREQQHVHARQNMFDGTWSKTPSMGWMFVPLVQYHGGGAAATIEPLKDHLADYELHFANTLGYGAQACWRGTRLYDAPETKAVVTKMVGWFKQYRTLLEADVIHLRRPDGRSLDYIMHVAGQEAMVVIYNPTSEEREEEIAVPLAKYGFDGRVRRTDSNGSKISPSTPDKLKVKVGGRSWTWVKFSQL